MLGAITHDRLVAAGAVARNVIGVPPEVIDFFAQVAIVSLEKDAAGTMGCQCVTIASFALIKTLMHRLCSCSACPPETPAPGAAC